MLDNLPGPNTERDIINRISAARGKAEPEAPTEEPEQLEVRPDEELIEDEPDLEQPEIEFEADESESPEAEISEAEEFYIDLDGDEIALSEVKEWRQGNLRQSDYTRKTQSLADDRKKVESEREELKTKASMLDERIAELETYMSDFQNADYDGMSLEELRDIDPGQYLKVTEQQKKREEALKKAKGSRSQLSEQDRMQASQKALSDLVKNNPQWVKDGKETEAYANDMSIVKNYLDGLGYSEDDQRGILTNGQGQIFIDAAKYHAGKRSNAAIAKKVRKAPVVTKPGGARRSQSAKSLDVAKANHRKHGTVETAIALRKAQKQFKGK